MTIKTLARWRARLSLAVGAAALAVLGGCVVAPVDAYDVGTPVAYPTQVYGPTYVAPAYPAYPAPYYYGPSVSLGVYGGWSDDRRYWRRPAPPPRRGWIGPDRPGPGVWDRPQRPSAPVIRPRPQSPHELLGPHFRNQGG